MVAGGVPTEVLGRVGTVLANVEVAGDPERCTPCLMLAHPACERGACTCPCSIENAANPEVAASRSANTSGSKGRSDAGDSSRHRRAS